MKPFSTLLLILAFYSVLPAQEINFSPLPDTCFDQFTFFLPKSQTDAPEAKFTRQLDSLLASPYPDTLALAIVHRRLAVLNHSSHRDPVPHARSSVQLIGQLSLLPEEEQAKSLFVFANALMVIGEHDSSFLLLETTITLNRRLYGAISPAIGANYRVMGSGYNNLSRYKEAMFYLTEAVDVERKVYQTPHPSLAKSLNVRAIAYYNIGEYQAAIRDLQESEQIILQTLGKEHPAMGDVYHIMGLSYKGMGDYDNALSYSKRSLTIREQTLAPTHGLIGYVCLHLGNVYLEIGDYPNAVFYQERGFKIMTPNDAQPPIDKIESMVLLYATVGDYEKEARAFESLIYHRDLSSFNKTEYVALAYHHHAFALLKQNRLEEALGWLEKAFELNRQINPDKPRQNHGVLLLKAEAFTKLHRVDEAISILENVLKTWPVFDKKKQAHVTMAATFFERFKAQRNGADLEKAWQNDLAALRTLDSLRYTYQSSASRIQQNELNFKLFEGALAVCHERQDVADAFWVAEKSKAQALLDNHRDDIARRMAGLPDSLLRLESALKSQIADLEKTAYEAPPGNERQIAEAALFEKKQSLNELLQTFETAYPAYFKLRYNTSLAGAAEVQARLPKATALLEYFVGDSSIYVFTLTQNKLLLNSLPKPANFETTVQDLRSALTDSELRFLKQDMEKFATASGKLHDWLLAAPLATLPSGIEHLVIVPDGALNYLPFEILGKNEGRPDFKSYPYLLNKFSVSYAASANLLLEQTSPSTVHRSPSTVNLFAGFAPSYTDADTLNQAVSRLRALLVRDEKYHLPGADREVKEIAELLSGKTWLGPAATKQAFKQQSAQFQILHLAMHSVMDDANPLFSKLLFTQSPDATEDNDLNANELFSMRIPARLVVLSACNTGAGKLRRGEGVMSLSRAFSYAGAPATVMSLWQAPDEATRQVMVSFYGFLKKGLRKDEAMRQAKLAHLSTCKAELANPFFWAGFVANGDMGALFGAE